MELKRDAHYRLTCDILCICIGAEAYSGGLYYLRAESEVQVIDPESRPFIEVRHSKGSGRLFAQDLVAKAVLIDKPVVRSAAA